MSEKTDTQAKAEEATETIKGLFANLVPVDKTTVTDIFGEEHHLSCTISARTQIKLLRLIEEVKDVEFNIDFSTEEVNIVDMLLSLANNEKFLAVLGKCFDMAYPKVVAEVKFEADQNGIEADDALDLFPIEDVIGAIAPLFIRLAKKTMGALQTVTES
tara:strand:+ start:446 stop:922 length:477 start_codon:yes stop_codon:yes gene_type:complete